MIWTSRRSPIRARQSRQFVPSQVGGEGRGSRLEPRAMAATITPFGGSVTAQAEVGSGAFGTGTSYPASASASVTNTTQGTGWFVATYTQTAAVSNAIDDSTDSIGVNHTDSQTVTNPGGSSSPNTVTTYATGKNNYTIASSTSVTVHETLTIQITAGTTVTGAMGFATGTKSTGAVSTTPSSGWSLTDTLPGVPGSVTTAGTTSVTTSTQYNGNVTTWTLNATTTVNPASYGGSIVWPVNYSSRMQVDMTGTASSPGYSYGYHIWIS